MNKEVTRWLDTILADAIRSVYTYLDETVDRAVSLSRITALRRKYISRLEESIKYIHLPYMADQRLLAELFVELYAFKTPLKYRLKKKRKSAGKQEDPPAVSVRDILSANNITILGEPGAGKTTFLRRVAYSVCTEREPTFFTEGTRHFPVLLECRGQTIRSAIDNHQARVNAREFKAREMQKDDKSEDYINRKLPPVPHPLLIAISEELHENGFPYSEHLTKAFLRKGNLMLFVDGLDEAPARHRAIVSEGLEYIKSHFADNRLIITCRTAEAEHLPRGFVIYEIIPLSETQKRNFVELWFSSQPGDAEEFLKRVVRTHIWSISDRPLLLTLLCALYEAGGDLPRYKVDLYRECAELALRRWDSIRHIKRQSVFQGLSTNQRMDILSKVAAEMMLEDQAEVSRAALRQRIGTAMEESSIEGSPGDMLNEIVSHTGLIQQVALNSYSFSHKSLQELGRSRIHGLSLCLCLP